LETLNPGEKTVNIQIRIDRAAAIRAGRDS
jgi:hypothetical protein